MTETCPTCPTCDKPLEPVTTNGWIDKRLVRADGLGVTFYGVFSTFDGLSGIFGWIEHPEQIPKGLFCRHGHIGLSNRGRIIR